MEQKQIGCFEKKWLQTRWTILSVTCHEGLKKKCSIQTTNILLLWSIFGLTTIITLFTLIKTNQRIFWSAGINRWPAIGTLEDSELVLSQVEHSRNLFLNLRCNYIHFVRRNISIDFTLECASVSTKLDRSSKAKRPWQDMLWIICIHLLLQLSEI